MNAATDNGVDTKPGKFKLLQKMKRTKSNRFNFAHRLKAKAEVKSYVINILSLAAIVASIYLLAYANHLSADLNRLIGVIIAGVSVSSLIMSLQDPVSDLARRANDAHRCAREISNLYGELQLDVIKEDVARKKYEEILNGYENHADVDNWKTLYERKADFPDDSNGVNAYQGVFLFWVSKYSSAILGFALIAGVIGMWFALIFAESYFVAPDCSIADFACGKQS